jgi:lysylphosphatidylglycerol synthase-like protein
LQLATALAILRRRLKQRRIRHLLDGVDALVRDRRRGARVLGWTVAATTIAASLGVHSPLTAAVLVTAALDLAGMVPLAPGNIGVTSAAVALALQRAGVNPTTAIASGLVFHGVQTLVSVTYVLISTALLTSESASAPRRRVRFVAAGLACSQRPRPAQLCCPSSPDVRAELSRRRSGLVECAGGAGPPGAAPDTAGPLTWCDGS